ncbi:hypothetical protein V8E54_006947 [Elaphomyces granulatus]
MELQDDVLQSQHHLLRDEDTVVELVKLKAELPQKGLRLRGTEPEEGAVALQALGCIDFSDARRRRGVVVADEALGNSQNERLPDVKHEWEEALFGIPLQSDDDSSDEDMEVDSDEDYDDFWKDQKVIVDGRLADPTSEQMLHPSVLPSGKTHRQMSILWTPIGRVYQLKQQLGV